MDRHIGKLSQSCFYQLRQLRTVSQSLSDSAAKMLINAFVVTMIDYCNIVLTGASASNIQRIQRIRNAAAQFLLRLPKFSHISAVMTGQLHWLPVHRRIRFKLLLMVAGCIAGRAPSYLRKQCILVSSVPGRRHLRSADQLLLTIPRCHGATAHKCNFSVAGPSAWNRLPTTLREAAVQLPRGSFMKDLKTHM